MRARDLRSKSREEKTSLMNMYIEAGNYPKATFMYDILELYGKRVRCMDSGQEGKCIELELIYPGAIRLAIVKFPTGTIRRTTPCNLEVRSRNSKATPARLEERENLAEGLFVLAKYRLSKYLPLYGREEPCKLTAARERLEGIYAQFEEHREKCFELLVIMTRAEAEHGLQSEESLSADAAYFAAEERYFELRQSLEDHEREYQRVWREEVYEQIFSRKEKKS